MWKVILISLITLICIFTAYLFFKTVILEKNFDSFTNDTIVVEDPPSPVNLSQSVQQQEIAEYTPQKFEDLVWKTYSNDQIGVSFIYPDNLRSQCVHERGSALDISYSKTGILQYVRVCSGMAYFFSIGLSESSEYSLDYWIKLNQAFFENGTLEKSSLAGLPAYKYKTAELQQTPSKKYYIKHKGNILLIEVADSIEDNQTEVEIYNKLINSLSFY